jgi:hypothetical protein
VDAVEPTLMRALVCLALVAAGAAGATAQTRPEPSLDLSVGYQVLHIPGQTYPLGISLEMSGALTSAVRIVAEAGVSIARRTISSYGTGTLTLYSYGGGPRVTARAGRALVYGQLLGGACGRMRISRRRPARHSLRGTAPSCSSRAQASSSRSRESLPPSARSTTSGCFSKSTGATTRHASSSACERPFARTAGRPTTATIWR